MILPSKHIPEEQTLLGVGAILLQHLESPQTITSLWNKVRGNLAIGNYERFVLGLDFLHIIGLVSFANGMLKKDAL